jgi:hypothetical protein
MGKTVLASFRWAFASASIASTLGISACFLTGCAPAGRANVAGQPAEEGTPGEDGTPARAGDGHGTDSDEGQGAMSAGGGQAPLAESPLAKGYDDGKPRLYAPAGLVTIHEKPSREAPVIGAIKAGQSVVMTDTNLPKERTLKRHYQCSEGWYPVAPRGFVCVGGGNHATKDGDDPRVLAARAVLPDTSSDYPFRVGVSVGAPQYLRIPTEEEQRKVEGDVGGYRGSPAAADDKKGGAVDMSPSGRSASKELLAYLKAAKPELTAKQELYDGYKISWVSEFDANGRTWLLTPELTIVPKDKVRQKALPKLEGIDLKEHPEIKLPLAFFWLDDSKKHVPGDGKKLVATEESYQRHTFVETTMDQAAGPGGLIYWKMKDGGYVKYPDVTIIQKIPARPAGIGPNDKWVEVRVTWGYLIAYEGDTPVYVTAISPGVDGINAAKHATARGKQWVKWKLYSGDMSGKDRGKPWFVDEVPWVQYYKGNYALHGAWWHNNFGRPMSHGCVNLSPPDAHNLFEWMDPQIPDGWYAVSPFYPYVKSTLILIRP